MNELDLELQKKIKAMNRFQIEAHLNTLVQSERELLVEILLTIKEIDRRALFLEAGFPNIFIYLQERCRCSNGTAQRRIDAARLLGELPEISEHLKSGALKLGQTTLVQKAVRASEAKNKKTVTRAAKLEILKQIVDLSERESEQKTAEYFEIPIKVRTREKTQADRSVRIEMTLTAEQYNQYQRAQHLVSHSLRSRDLTEFLEFVCGKIIKQKTPSERSRSKPEKPNPQDLSTTTVAVNSHTAEAAPPENNGTTTTERKGVGPIPEKLRKEIIARDGQCLHQDKVTGRVCGSRWHLQVDHKTSLWAGGTNDPENLHSLCGNHNRHKYQKEAGIHRV